ncbi:MAG: hypothetical protein ACOC56_01280 [Atribacterota bacterium]
MSLKITNIYRDEYREEYMVHTQDSISNDTICAGVIIKDESMDHLYFVEGNEEEIVLEFEELKEIYEFMKKLKEDGK